jgi:amino acid adenylation domain-containing protein
VRTLDVDPAYILHTSGSTGTPKLIQHTHRSAMSFVDWAVAEYSLTQADRLSNHSSHHTCFATFDYYAAARAGGSTVILTPAAMMMPASLSALLERERISVWYSVPTALVHLSLRGDLEARDLSAIRWVLFAGETFPAKHLDRIMRQLPQARFSHVYGSTEVNVCTYYHLRREISPQDPLPIGRACATSRTLVVDRELEPVADGGVGELLVHGSSVMTGYWGDPEASRRALVRRPAAGGFEDVYFRTGDRVRTLDDGNLTFVARADFQVKIRGHRVELEEVENALLAVEQVEEAAALAVPDGEGSLALHAAVVTARPAPSGQQILAQLGPLLPAYAIPAGLSVLASLPRTPTGKVDRKALESQATASSGGTDG